MSSSQNFHLTREHDGLNLAAVLRSVLADRSWSQVRRLIAGRRVQVNGNLCLDDERKVKAGDVLKLWEQPLAAPARDADVKLAYVDEYLVVVNKPAGVTTLRHREETDLPQRRKQLQPTLDELLPRLLASHLGIRLEDSAETSPQRKRGVHRRLGRKPVPDKRLQIYPVHRLDRDTSGVMVFARTREAEQKLIRMFAKHEVQRAYVAVAHGHVDAQTIDTWLVRDRGDGLRGSTPLGDAAVGAVRAITRVRPMEHVSLRERGADYTIVECRLETGRTHQIRIHLSEIGHRLCGEKTYTHSAGQKPQDDTSRAPRQVLHAAELAFIHPITNQPLRFRMPLPQDLKEWLLRMRRGPATDAASR
jgi:23S rRNA pseudouridine1911/1915/1917 synthase